MSLDDPRPSTTPPTGELAARLDAVWSRVRAAGGDPARIRLVAVSKGFGPDEVAAVRRAGVVDVGESYAQELVAKAARLEGAPDVRWHFVGRLQRNKVRTVAPLVTLWHSVDRPALGDEIARRAPGAAVLVQVNVSGQERQGGCAPGETASLVEHLADRGLAVRGLMAVGALGPPEGTRSGFRLLDRLADQLELAERSMGMSADLEVAVQEGATLVRVGTALFGARPGADPARH